jgi:hypothetical protein
MDFTLNLQIEKKVSNAPQIVQKILTEKSIGNGVDEKKGNTKAF